jgi:tryptophanyl-tRNA synthetase
MTKPVILTGIRANNDLHIGNYFGAMLPMVEMANQKAGDYQINMFIPDLHSFTTPIDHSLLQEQIMNNGRLYAAAGLPLDHDDILLYRQSYVPAHSELTWILDCFAGFGELSRMTQFKDKSAKLTSDRVGVGLFNYPVLMAADVLLYGAEYVPVGEDQTQHLEFARDIAERMNKQFDNLLTVPDPVDKQHEFFNRGQALRIKDLADPTKKMSKSTDSDKGVIFLTDSPDDAAKKVMSATTDDKASINYNPIEQPGISNLLQILALLRGHPIDDVVEAYKGQSSYGEFKRMVADEVAAFLTDFQKKLGDVDDDAIVSAFERSEVKANEQANATLLRVQKAVGLRKQV